MKGGTGWWLMDHFVLPRSQTLLDLSILVSPRFSSTTWVFEPLTRVSDSKPESLLNSQVFHYLPILFLHLLYNMIHLFNEIIHYPLITLIHHHSQPRTSDLLKNLHQFKYLYCLTLQYFNLYNPFSDCLILTQTKFLNDVVP